MKKAVEIIKEQMLAMQNGEFSEEEIHQTKKCHPKSNIRGN